MASEYEYVLGFAFGKSKNADRLQHVMLIRKSHPDFQKNKFNGIGGKIENSRYHLSNLSDAGQGIKREEFYYQKLEMIREFKEETKLDIELDWKMFALLTRNPLHYHDMPSPFAIYCFYAIYPETFYDAGLYDLDHIKSLEYMDESKDEVNEDIYIISIDQIRNIPLVEHTRALLDFVMEKINKKLDYKHLYIEIK